jgi:hypothetical protein
MAASLVLIRNSLAPNLNTSITTKSLPIQPRGLFRLTLTVYGGSQAQCSNASASSFLDDASYLSNWEPPSRVSPPAAGSGMPQYNSEDGSCTYVWMCAECTMLSSKSIITYNSMQPSWISFLSYKLETPSLLSVKTATAALVPDPFLVSGYEMNSAFKCFVITRLIVFVIRLIFQIYLPGGLCFDQCWVGLSGAIKNRGRFSSNELFCQLHGRQRCVCFLSTFQIGQ